ncbi:hypothetical protein [Pseudomonas sp. BF-R-30]|nr:hypothetical protein [Pseudomonas sp. BF-R-30]
MTEYNANMTIFEVFYRNEELLWEETVGQAWCNILFTIQNGTSWW